MSIRVNPVLVDASASAAAFALSAAALSSPLGPFGGALYGATLAVARIPLNYVAAEYLHANSLCSSEATKTFAWALNFFGSFAIAWAALALTGAALTLSHLISLALVSVLTAIPVTLFYNALGLQPFGLQFNTPPVVQTQ